MEQLANMPLWAQILSMGSFMFASGVLMTRIPFAPALILLAFGLIHHLLPKGFGWWILGISILIIAVPVFFLLQLFSTPIHAGDGMGVGMAGVYFLILLGLSILIAPLVAFSLGTIIRLGQWFFSLQLPPWQSSLAIGLFAVGIAYGISDLALSGYSWFGFLNLEFFNWRWSGFFTLGGFAIGVCIISMAILVVGAGNLRIGMSIVLIGLLLFGTIKQMNNFAQASLTQVLQSPAGNTKRVKKILKKGVDVNKRDKNGNLPLTLAARDGNEEIVKLLLDKGADVNAKNDIGNTALIYAVQNEHVEMVKLLLEKGADVNAKDSSSKTALIYAV
ncbi:MAG: ankyrin repeat domain-containing protein, partial [Elusimicrobiaceae bacterium]|nr:ankyrin repeat domain-containing protein [Elusimicrobiaceae bacterium]